MTADHPAPARVLHRWLPAGVSRRLAVGFAIVAVTTYEMLDLLARGVSVGIILIAMGIFASVAVWCRHDAVGAPMWLIVLAAVVVQLVGLRFGPLTSDDAYRYVWDGRVQLAGIDPYRYAPLDPAVAFLRDPVLFPAGGGTHINRPSVPTLYPPVAQLWFAWWALVTPWGWGTFGVQFGAAAAVVATTALLARFLGERRGVALLYGACPVVAVEAGSAAHLDAVAALCLCGFGWAAMRARNWLAGILLGLAAGLKLVPLLLVPALLRRGRWRTSVTGAALVVAGYLPHVLAVGALIWGYLPGYWDEEGYDGASRFVLLFWLPSGARSTIGLTIALGLAILALRRSGREPVLVTCGWLFGGALLVATPAYPWYALGFAVIVVMSERLEWLAVWPAIYSALAFYSQWAQALAFGAAALTIVAITRRRHRRAITETKTGPRAGALPRSAAG